MPLCRLTGSLNPKLGGKPVRIPIESEVYNLIFTEFERDGLWPVDPDKNVQSRRSVCLYNKRSVRLPLLSAFDQPDTIIACPVRATSPERRLEKLTRWDFGALANAIPCGTSTPRFFSC